MKEEVSALPPLSDVRITAKRWCGVEWTCVVCGVKERYRSVWRGIERLGNVGRIREHVPQLSYSISIDRMETEMRLHGAPGAPLPTPTSTAHHPIHHW